MLFHEYMIFNKCLGADYVMSVCWCCSRYKLYFA